MATAVKYQRDVCSDDLVLCIFGSRCSYGQHKVRLYVSDPHCLALDLHEHTHLAPHGCLFHVEPNNLPPDLKVLALDKPIFRKLFDKSQV